MGAASDWLKQRAYRWVDQQFDPAMREKLKALPGRQNEYGYDSFGFHRDDLKVAALIAKFFHHTYFRVESHGAEQIPEGRVLIVSNHSGQLPFDAIGIMGAAIFDRDPPRLPRAMIERFIPDMPFVSYLFPRWGQIIGTPENCVRLLEADEAILVFPEGAKGISKPFHKRYQLQEFGSGFLRLALQTRSPIVPTAVIGAEEQAPAWNARPLARLIGAPAFPLTPIPPFFPIVPLPTRYRIWFGEPITFEGDPDDDDEVIDEKVKAVKNRIQSMIHVGLRERRRVFW